MHIDLWTLALQTVNVLVLIWLLAHFLFRPVAAVIAARQQAADRLLADAEAARRQAADGAAALAQERQNLDGERQHLLADARAAAETEHARLLQQAAEAVARLQTEARQAIARDRDTMRTALEREATDLALAIATRLLQRIPPRALNQAFVETLAEALATHPARTALADAASANATLELRSAVPLDDTARADTRAMLARVLGGTPRIDFRTDPALLAGIELTAPSVLIRNSWRADLDRIMQTLDETASHDLPQHVA